MQISLTYKKLELEELKSKQLGDIQSVADTLHKEDISLLIDNSIIIINPAVFFFHPNHASTSLSTGLGSTSTLITDMFGDPYQFFLNLPFGEIEERDSPTLKNNKKSCRQLMAEQRRSGSFNNPYKFNGKELDGETSLYYYGARYYNPRISNWLSVDPLAEHTMTPYQYTYQNPVKYIDPTGMAAESVDDIIIRGKNNSSLTLKTSIELEFESPLDFKGNHTLYDLSDIAIGYERGFNATGASAVGTSYNTSLISVLFLGGDYSGYWYDYIGGEAQFVLNSSAEGTVGVHKNWFIAFNKKEEAKIPTGFSGIYYGGGGSIGGKLAGIGLNINGSMSISEDKSWKVLSLGASATIGPQIGLFFGGAVGAEGHLGATKLLDKEIPTKERSTFDKIFNWFSHIIN